jgi:hypothetical protein
VTISGLAARDVNARILGEMSGSAPPSRPGDDQIHLHIEGLKIDRFALLEFESDADGERPQQLESDRMTMERERIDRPVEDPSAMCLSGSIPVQTATTMMGTSTPPH